MSVTPLYYRLVIRNAADDADEIVMSSFPDDDYPFINAAPSGDGQAIDPITGAPTTGDYSITFNDAEVLGVRPFTAVLADFSARQQLIARRAYVKQSSDGATWTDLIPGYVTRVRLPDAISYHVAIGQTRRREANSTIFKEATSRFPGVTCVIGGPVIGGFAGIIPDNGGWTYHVNQVASGPAYIQLKIDEGFDPRKDPTDTFTTVSTAIANYTNDWARPYFEPSTNWLAASTAIQGYFSKLRVLLKPISPAYDSVTNPYRIVTPLAQPAAITGPWYNPTPNGDFLVDAGDSSLFIPDYGDSYGDDPSVITPFTEWAPSVDDTFEVFVYATPISEQNPLHIYMRPAELWEAIRLEAGYIAGTDYDDAVISDITATINAALGQDVFLALRITEAVKISDFDKSTLFGPFRLSSRISDGLLQLISIRILETPLPTTVVTIDDLRNWEGDVFDVDESTAVTAIILKQLRFRPWNQNDTDQPGPDGLTTLPWPTDSVENAEDDIPTGLKNEVEVGNISGTIMYPDGTDIVPLPFDQFISRIADEIFDRFGRGGIAGEISCRSTVTEQVGDEIIVNLIHRPVSTEGATPVTVRGGEKRVQIVQRTENPEGPVLRIIDSAVSADDIITDPGDDEIAVEDTVVPDVFLFAISASKVMASWSDSYPQFAIEIQFEAHPPSDSTFNLVYGGDRELLAGTTSEIQTAIGTGWTVRARIKYLDPPNESAWGSYSNEVTTVADSPPDVPTDIPSALVVTSTVSDTAHAEWTNTNTSLQIRIKWQGSVEPSDPSVWANVAGGTKLLVANDTDDDQATGPAVFARAKLAYVNGAGVEGPYTDWSDPVEIAA